MFNTGKQLLIQLPIYKASSGLISRSKSIQANEAIFRFYSTKNTGSAGYVATIKTSQLGIKGVKRNEKYDSTCFNIGYIPCKVLSNNSNPIVNSGESNEEIEVENLKLNLNRLINQTINVFTCGTELKNNKITHVNSFSKPNLFKINSSQFSLMRNQLVNFKSSNQVRFYSSDKKEEKGLTTEDKIKKYEDEIQLLEKQIKELKGQTKDVIDRVIKVEDGKYDKQTTDEDEVIYRIAYDFPGFKSKNIKVFVSDKILKVNSIQKSSKKDNKEYIFENTTEEILPNEVDVDKMKATFDAENGLLIIEAHLPDDCNLKEIKKITNEKNDKLFKLEKELEAKKKELSNLKS